MEWDGEAIKIASVDYSTPGTPENIFIDLDNGSVKKITSINILAPDFNRGSETISFYRATTEAGMTSETNILKGSAYLGPTPSFEFYRFTTSKNKIGIKILGQDSSKIFINVKYKYLV